MDEYIKREELYEKAYWHGEHPTVDNPFPDGVDAIDIKDVDAIPAADVAPVRHGRWEKNVRGDYSIVCSECGYGLPTDAFAWMECNRTSEEREFCIWIADVKNYCPNCGCRMDEEVDT